MEIRIYNTLKRSLEPFRPLVAGRVGMYVCGVTVYDYCHIGHARAMITFDVIYRYLVHKGYHVTFVRNHTDIDDKVIARAREQGVDPLELSGRFIEALEEDLAGLRLVRPTHEPKVSEHIQEIIHLISRIIANGHAYEARGDVYFAVESFRRYGQLSGRTTADMRAGERIEADHRKKHPADFALWKSARPGEPSWESPWGPGRPGWHIECSAMSQHYLGPVFDIHGGGSDLIFPHHENEIAQSEAGSGQSPFVRYWIHNGMVTLAEEKMSKSLGNIISIRQVLKEMPGEVLRLLFLEHHYRSPVPYSSERMGRSLVALDRLYQARELALKGYRRAGNDTPAAQKAQLAEDFGDPGRDLLSATNSFSRRLHASMDEDFNTSQTIGTLFDLVRATNRFGALPKAAKKGAPLLAEAHDCFELAATLLGIGESDPAVFFEEVKSKRLAAMDLHRSWVEDQLQERTQARKTRDWATADAIRTELDRKGIIVMDGPQGSTWRVRV